MTSLIVQSDCFEIRDAFSRSQQTRSKAPESSPFAQSPYNTEIIPTKIRRLKLSGKFPEDMRISTLKFNTLLESNPLKSRILVRRLAVSLRGRDFSYNRLAESRDYKHPRKLLRQWLRDRPTKEASSPVPRHSHTEQGFEHPVPHWCILFT